MHIPHTSSHKRRQLCCPFDLVDCSGMNKIVQCDMVIGVAALQPFLGVSSLNFGPLFSGLFLG
jgi:hypothetical protein